MLATELTPQQTSYSRKFHYLTNFSSHRLRVRNRLPIFLLQLTPGEADTLPLQQRINLKIAAPLYKCVSAEMRFCPFLQQGPLGHGEHNGHLTV